jgi:hypothetical protein
LNKNLVETIIYIIHQNFQLKKFMQNVGSENEENEDENEDENGDEENEENIGENEENEIIKKKNKNWKKK